MKAQLPGRRWLAALLLVGLTTQTAVAATHSTLGVHPDASHEQPTDGEERGGHDPASCSFCRFMPAVEHGIFDSSLSLPIVGVALPSSVDTDSAAPAQPLWTRPAPRAPPSPPSS